MDTICSLIEEIPNSQSCNGVKECETLKTISAFRKENTFISIDFKDENGNIFTRAFELNQLIDNSLDGLNPACITSQGSWDIMNHSQRIQAILDHKCLCCPTTTTTTIPDTTSTITTTEPENTTTTSTTTLFTTTISPSTTTTTTLTCTSYTVYNPNPTQRTVWYRDCITGQIVVTYILGMQTKVYCVRTGSLLAATTNITETGECTTSTTTIAPTTIAPTTTTSTTTIPLTTTTSTTFVECSYWTFTVTGIPTDVWSLDAVLCNGTPIFLSGTVLDGAPSPLCIINNTLELFGAITATSAPDCLPTTTTTTTIAPPITSTTTTTTVAPIITTTTTTTVAPLITSTTTTTTLCSTCASGYTPTADGKCVQIYSSPVINPPGGIVNAVAVSNVVYSSLGTIVYNPGYTVSGTGTYITIDGSNAYWRNLPGNTIQGPLNKTGLWAPLTSGNAPGGEKVGFSFCITITTPKTYYIGFGSDNFGIIRIDGTNIVIQTSASLLSMFPNIDRAFKLWHIFPIQLSAGEHIIEIIGENEPNPSPAVIGAEIYDNTLSEIIAATSNADLNKLFTSSDPTIRTGIIQYGDRGYSCQPGYSLKLCGGAPTCEKIDYINCGELPTTTTTTTIFGITTTTTTIPPLITTTTTTTTVLLTAYWGWKADNSVLSESNIITSPNFQTVSPPQNIICTFGGGSASPQYLWMAEPLACTTKTKWQDNVNPFNNGNIGNPPDAVNLPVISGGYRFYIWDFATQQTNPISFNV